MKFTLETQIEALMSAFHSDIEYELDPLSSISCTITAALWTACDECGDIPLASALDTYWALLGMDLIHCDQCRFASVVAVGFTLNLNDDDWLLPLAGAIAELRLQAADDQLARGMLCSQLALAEHPETIEALNLLRDTFEDDLNKMATDPGRIISVLDLCDRPQLVAVSDVADGFSFSAVVDDPTRLSEQTTIRAAFPKVSTSDPTTIDSDSA